MNKKETMIHPFTHVLCEVIHLQIGEVIDSGDIYRSATYSTTGHAISKESPGLGKWFYAGEMLEGSPVGNECNVHFIRLIPFVEDSQKN